MKTLNLQTSPTRRKARPSRRSGGAAVILRRSYVILAVILSLSLSRSSSLGQPSSGSTVPATTPAPPPSAPAKLSASELEKLAMPIALHPDPLIGVILPTSMYPVQIVQTARFVKDKNNIPKIDDQP